MSILSALKARGAKGKNIEEAIKTLPSGGGSEGEIFIGHATFEKVSGESSEFTVSEIDTTYNELKDVIDAGIPCFIVVTMPLNYPGAPTSYALFTCSFIEKNAGAVRFTATLASNYIYKLDVTQSGNYVGKGIKLF